MPNIFQVVQIRCCKPDMSSDTSSTEYNKFLKIPFIMNSDKKYLYFLKMHMIFMENMLINYLTTSENI